MLSIGNLRDHQGFLGGGNCPSEVLRGRLPGEGGNGQEETAKPTRCRAGQEAVAEDDESGAVCIRAEDGPCQVGEGVQVSH